MGDARSQNTQLMRAVKAIATAAANTTPSVTGSTVYNNASSGQYEVITSVLDNTVAGGWSLKADQTTLSGAIVSTNTFFETLMLYNTTGKSSLPYIYFSMIEGSVSTVATNPGPFLSFGYASTLANCNYGSGYNVKTQFNAIPSTTVYSGACPFSNNAQDFNRVAGIINTGTRVYYISATSEYIHIQQDVATTSTQHCGSWFHLGLRTYNSWEDNYSDNPYWVALWCSQGLNSGVYGGQADDAAGYWTVMRTINTTTGVVATPVNVYRATNPGATSCVLNPVTGFGQSATNSTPYQMMVTPQVAAGVNFNYPTNYDTAAANGGTTYTQFISWSHTAGIGLQANIFNTFYSTGGIGNPVVGVTSDSTTNALISPALPIYTRYLGNGNFGGYMKNIFQGGIYSSAAELDLYHVPNAIYTIDGSSFIGLRMGYASSGAGPNPRQIVYVKSS